jgi:hypothetical protein
MSEDYPAPPPELVQQWRAAASNVPASLSTDPGGRRDYIDFIATKAARWGAALPMTDYKALCARMADELDHYRQLLMDDRRETHALATEARAALAQPEPEPPADGEVAELVDWLRDNGASLQKSGYGSATVLANLARTADLLEQLSGQSG